MPNLRAIKCAAVRFSNGAVHFGTIHAQCVMEAVEDFGSWNNAADNMIWEGFVTHGGELLNREAALTRAAELKQLDREHFTAEAIACGTLGEDEPPVLESIAFENTRAF